MSFCSWSEREGRDVIFWVALRKELLEQWRSYRLLAVGVVLVLFGLASPLIAKYTPEFIKLVPMGEELAKLMPPPTAADAVEQYLKNSSQFGILLALLVTMGAVAQEKDKGTAALMLVKPLPRGVFLVAKFVALGLTFAVSILLAGLACYYYTLLLFGSLDFVAWLALNGLLLLMLLVYVAATLLFSTLTRSQVVAGGLGFAFLMALGAVGAIPGVGQYLPAHLLAGARALMGGGGGTFWPAVWVSLGLILASLVAAWLIFEQQEL
jgi:ABC-2 type transport system permease protein